MWIATAIGVVAAVFAVVLFYCMVVAGRADREIESWAARRREGEEL